MPVTLQILLNKEEIIKQISTLKPFNLELCKANAKKSYVSDEENNCEEEMNSTPQDRSFNIVW